MFSWVNFFFKNREQKMFDKNLDDVKKFKRLKTIKKVAKWIVDLENLNDFFAFDILSLNVINWIFLKNSFNDENVVKSFYFFNNCFFSLFVFLITICFEKKPFTLLFFLYFFVEIFCTNVLSWFYYYLFII